MLISDGSTKILARANALVNIYCNETMLLLAIDGASILEIFIETQIVVPIAHGVSGRREACSRYHTDGLGVVRFHQGV